MAIDTPAKIIILGAGPIGLEAALYARFLGYDVVVFDRGDVTANVRSLGDTPLAEPFGKLHSPLALAALEAQDENYHAPPDDAVLTAEQWGERYLLPLSQTDLLSDRLRLRTEVLALRRIERPGDEEFEDDRGDLFQVTVRDAAGVESTCEADLVFDARGLNADAPTLSADEPHYYVLGAKSAAAEGFTFQQGLVQIRDLFRVIGERATLDLYAGKVTL